MSSRATFRFGVVVLGALAASSLSGCIIVSNSSSDSPRYSETRTMRVPVGAGAGVDVKTRNGSVEVSSSAAPEAVVTATLHARTQERLDETRVIAEAVGNRLDVRVEWPNNRAQSGEGCSFRIDAPSPSGVRIESSNARISLRDCAGHAELDTSNGSIRVMNHAGDVNATSSNGKIELRDITGAADANTSNASIDLVNVSGRAFASTSNASVLVHLAENSSGPVQIRSSNGSIDLALGRDFAGDLRLSTSNGRIRFDSPVRVQDMESNRSANLRFGTGGGASSAITSNGSITITSNASAEALSPAASR
ncbi:MAG: DUF4097 family beta strand repeat protein [Phycisphaerae bacterium]|nr:DUF4097 family beta strand repeat protein [Phycisphaerae bacterium]